VDFATYLNPSDLARFRVLAGADHAIHDVASVADLEVVIRTRPIDVVVVDPQAVRQMNIAALGTLFAKYPALPVIGYVSVTAEGIRGSLALAAFGVRHVVLRGYDDQPAAFRATVDQARADMVSASLLERLAPARAKLPGPLDAAITILFRAPHTVRGSAALARLAAMPARTCSRALQRAGLSSALLFVRAARVIRAYHYLRGGSDRVADIAARLGYGTPDALARDTRDVTGCRPSALVRTVGPDALVALVASRLTRPPTTRQVGGPASRAGVALSPEADDVDEPGGAATGEANPRAPPLAESVRGEGVRLRVLYMLGRLMLWHTGGMDCTIAAWRPCVCALAGRWCTSGRRSPGTPRNRSRTRSRFTARTWASSSAGRPTRHWTSSRSSPGPSRSRPLVSCQTPTSGAKRGLV
jgi:AraC-like DNA-binding protein